MDNVAVTPGAGATIATDDVAGVQFQKVKLDFGGDGASDPVVGSLPTEATPVPALAYYPAFVGPPDGEDRAPTFDEYGAQFTRGGVTTDEGSFRLNFPGSSTSRSLGTCTFTNGSRLVTGTGGFSTAVPRLQAGDYVRLTADGDAAYSRVYSIDSDAALTLEENYAGAGGTGASDEAPYKPTLGTGGSVSVASGLYTLTCGTSAAVTHYVVRAVDYGPLVWQSTFNISQRIANQDIYRGLFDSPSATMRTFCRFRFTGTTNTSVICETGWTLSGAASGTDVQTTTVTLPNGATTATNQSYRIELRGEVVTFYVNDIQVAQHRDIAPGPYDVLMCGTVCANGTTPASSTTVNVRTEVCNNIDSLRMSIANIADTITALPPNGISLAAVNVTANNTDFYVLDCINIAEVSLQVSSVGGGATISWQASNDPAFAATVAPRAIPGAGGAHATSTTAVGHWIIPRVARYLRIRTTAYTSGTITANITSYATPGRVQSIDTTYNGTQAVTATGAAAHDAAISGSPVRLAGRALTSDYNAVATGDVADLKTTLTGALIVKQDAIPELSWIYAAATGGIVNTTTAVTIKTAAAAGIRNYLKSLQIAHDLLGGVTEIAIRDGASGTVLWRGKLQTPAMEGRDLVFDPPLRGSAATLMEVVTLTAVTGGVYINAQGFTAP